MDSYCSWSLISAIICFTMDSSKLAKLAGIVKTGAAGS